MKLILLIILSLLVFAPANLRAQEKQSDNPLFIYQVNEGARFYKEQKFLEAEEHFRRALELEPTNQNVRVFLARDLHQQYLTNRHTPENIKKGEEAVELYQKILTENQKDEATNDALASLIGSLKGADALKEYRSERANNEQVKPVYRAKALTFLAGEKYNCVNEVTEAAKDTILENNEAVFVFKKPENLDDFATAKQCADDGLMLIEKVLLLDDTKSSPFSYKASLLIQKSRLAEMDGNTADKDKFKAEAEAPKKRFQVLSQAEAKAREKEEAGQKKAQ